MSEVDTKELRDMPVVTVEQIDRFRTVALETIKRLAAENELLQKDVDSDQINMHASSDLIARLRDQRDALTRELKIQDDANTLLTRELEGAKLVNELAKRLLSAVIDSDHYGITCLDIEGRGNWFDVRKTLLTGLK